MKRLTISSDVNASLQIHPSTATSKVDCGTDWLGTGAITLSIWLKRVQKQGTSNVRLFDNGTTYMSFGGVTSGSATSSKIVFVSDGSADGVGNAKSGDITNITNWNHYVVTRNASGTCNFYVNGILSGSANQASGTPGAATTNLIIGNNAASTRSAYTCLLSKAMTFNRVLTANEIYALARNNKLPADSDTSLQSFHPLDDGKGGTVARDLSRYGRTGTLTAPISRVDVPTISRKPVSPNLIKNGDFEVAPPGGIATISNAVWIDGTSTGGTDINANVRGYGWANNKSGSASSLFDNTVAHSGKYSLKLSTTAIASLIEVRGILGTPTIHTLQQQGIKVKPSTQYTCTFWMKTNYVSGDSNSGAVLGIWEYSNTPTLLASNSGPTVVKTTTDWTQYSVTFTTQSATCFVQPVCLIYGHTGTATLIMDAWFDDITLVETNAATPRRTALALPRLKIRDFTSSIKTVDGGSDLVDFTSNIALTGPCTFAFWGKYSSTASPRTIFGHNTENEKIGFNANKWFFRFVNAGLSDNSVSYVQDNRWHFYVVTRDASDKINFYVDAATPTRLFSNAAQSGTYNVKRLFVSSAAASPGGFTDDVMIFDRCLNATEISNLYYKGVFDSSNLLLRYKFNEGSGTTAIDTSGNGNNGTFSTSTYSTDVPIKSRTTVS